MSIITTIIIASLTAIGFVVPFESGHIFERWGDWLASSKFSLLLCPVCISPYVGFTVSFLLGFGLAESAIIAVASMGLTYIARKWFV
jgi:hypothetical protein